MGVSTVPATPSQGRGINGNWAARLSTSGPPPLGIISAVVIVAAAVILAGVLLLRPSPSSGGPKQCSPCSIGLTFGTPSQTSNSAASSFCASAAGVSDWCYDLAVGSVGGGLIASDLAFALQTPNGAPVHFTSGTPAIQLESANSSSLGSYSFRTGAWSSGGTTTLSTTQTIVLDLGCAVSGTARCSPVPSGEVLVGLGVGQYSGQVQATLP